jgi:phage head maturation protease
MTTFHTKTQHGSDIYRVLGLHMRHGSVDEFATGFRVRDKKSTQRSIA